MAELDSNTLGALLGAGALYVQLMPSLTEVRRASSNSEMAVDVRNGLMVGTGILVGVGTMISLDAKNWRPLQLMGGAALILALAYEGTLRRRGAVSVVAVPERKSMGRYGM